MKLATLQDGSRDGQLVVVSRDLATAHYASGIAHRLQQALEDWGFYAPQLQDLYDALNAGRARHAFPFDPQQCLAPLPRAYQWVEAAPLEDAQPAPPAPVPLRVLCGDSLAGPRTPMPWPPLPGEPAAALDFGVGLAAITGDLPAGCGPAQALDGVRLLLLANAIRVEGANGGALHERPVTAFAPVAITPDELGAAWDAGRPQLALQSHWNGRKFGLCEASAATGPGLGELIAAAARVRALRAGSLVGTGALCQAPQRDAEGRMAAARSVGSIGAKRRIETLLDGRAATGFLQLGDTVRIDTRARDGSSVFGAIEQTVGTAPAPEPADATGAEPPAEGPAATPAVRSRRARPKAATADAPPEIE